MPAAERMTSLDVVRGITIAGMILVNNPGSWGAIYPPLEHAPWHGLTPTDLVFPFFLFIVGVSIALALGRRAEKGGSMRDLYVKIVRRSLIIFGLGLVLGGFPYYDLATMRIPGVLQRIAVCYLVTSLVFLKTTWKAQAAIAAALLVLYWAAMTLIPVPGFGAGDLSMEGNLAAHVDRVLLAGHTWKPLYDPEGILSTIPSIATALCGVLVGHLLRSKQTPVEKTAALFVAATAAMVAGWIWGGWFPVNKALWTSSYVLLTAGMAAQLLAFCLLPRGALLGDQLARPRRRHGPEELHLRAAPRVVGVAAQRVADVRDRHRPGLARRRDGALPEEDLHQGLRRCCSWSVVRCPWSVVSLWDDKRSDSGVGPIEADTVPM
jgi:predicted acyltransferase